MMKARQGFIRPYAPALVEFNRVLDAAWTVVALVLACEVRGIAWSPVYMLLALLAVAVYSIAGTYSDLYRSWRASSLRIEIGRIWLCWTVTALVVVFVVYALELLPSTRRPVLLLWFAIGYLILGLTRFGVRVSLRWLRLRGRNFRTAAIVGATEMGARIAHNIRHTAWMGVRVFGCFDDRRHNPSRTYLRDIDLRGSIDDLVRLVQDGEVDILYVALPMRAELRFKALLDRLRDTTVSVYYAPDFTNFDLLHARWDMLDDIPLVSVVDTPFTGLNGVMKRIFDISVALAILVLMALPMLIIVLHIRWTSPEPVILTAGGTGRSGMWPEMKSSLSSRRP